jgi:2-keto-4-pentenoate hydratase
MSIDVATAIEEFCTARARGELFPQTYFGRHTLDDAYRIQLALIDHRVAAGERQTGCKVGLTATVIQEQFGSHEPVFACVLEIQPSGHQDNGAPISAAIGVRWPLRASNTL